MADNIYMVGSSASETESRSKDVANIFATKCLHYDQSSLHIFSSSTAQQHLIHLQLPKGDKLLRISDLEVVGAECDPVSLAHQSEE